MANESKAITLTVTALGRTPPVPREQWPETFERRGQTWKRDHLTVAANGEVQTAEYQSETGDWLIVSNE